VFGFQPETIVRVVGQLTGEDDLPLCLVDETRVREEENGPGSVEMGFCLPGLRSSCRRLQGTIGKIYGALRPFGQSRSPLRQAARLWALQTEQKTTELQRTLWNVIRLPGDELDLEALSDAVQNPPRNVDLDLEALSKLLQLVTEAEHWVWRISALSVASRDDADEVSVEDLFQREKAPVLVARLARVFPEFTDLDITNAEDVKACVSEAMRKLHILRSSIVGESDVSGE